MTEKKKKPPFVRCPICGGNMRLSKRNAAIVQAREEGETLETIAQRYGVTRSRIHAICKEPDKWKGLANDL